MRAFVVGNGRSLLKTNLDRLVGEVTFAMNRIDMLYEPAPDYGISGTRWRPTYYLFIEWLQGYHKDRMRQAIRDEPEPDCAPDGVLSVNLKLNPYRKFVIPMHVAPGIEQCFIRESHKNIFEQARVSDRRWVGKRWPNLRQIPINCEHASMYSQSKQKPTDWHLPVWCHYGGTMNVALQFAFAMGFEPVFVIGCDLDFRPIHRTTIADPNHFHPDYWTWEDNPLEYRDDTLIEVHQMAQRAFDRAGRHIYNAGIGGKLEVHERVDFMEITEETHVMADA